MNKSNSFIYYLLNFIHSIPLFALLWPLFAYFVSNLHVLSKATDVTYVIAADTMVIGQYWFLVFQKAALRTLLERLEEIVYQS